MMYEIYIYLRKSYALISSYIKVCQNMSKWILLLWLTHGDYHNSMCAASGLVFETMIYSNTTCPQYEDTNAVKPVQ